MKLGYFPYVLYRDFDSTRRDDVEGLALVALPNDVRAVELVPVLYKGVAAMACGESLWLRCEARFRPLARHRREATTEGDGTRLLTPRPSHRPILSIAPP